jgi:hypothetical protein
MLRQALVPCVPLQRSVGFERPTPTTPHLMAWSEKDTYLGTLALFRFAIYYTDSCILALG